MKQFFCIATFLICNLISGQVKGDSLAFKINFKWKDEALLLNKKYASNQDTIQISKLKFYLSNIKFFNNEGFEFAEENSFHLIDLENYKPFFIKNVNIKSLSKITFQVGIDSLTSVSGALSGDLDPTKGMYWAWQSGYINMKIEGKSATCKTRNNEFQYHIGGYLKPFYAMREVVLFINKEKFEIVFDLSKFFEKIDLKTTNSIMTPSAKACQIADLFPQLFSIQ